MTLIRNRFQKHHYGEDSYVLEIKRATEGDSGSYTCVARNGYGCISSSATVRIFDFPTEECPRFLKRLKTTDFIAGKNCCLEVSVSGVSKPTVKWFKDSISIKENKRIEVIV